MSERVDIVVVTYNSAATIEKTLGTILAAVQDGLARCIVVDNGSTDDTLSILQHYRSSIDVIESTNLGFAAGCNIGIRASGNDYILLHNPDSYLELDDLRTLVEFFDAKPAAQVIAPAILEAEQEWQGVGGRTTPVTILKEALGRGQDLRVEARHGDAPFRTDWVCGALFMIRRAVLEQTGLLDETYFMYFEETDLCYQVEKKRW